MSASPVDVDIVVPCYNGQATIGRTLRSIGAPPGIDARIIVVDDGSNPPIEIEPRLQGPATRLLRLPVNVGQSLALNRAFEISTASAVVVLDADDELVPEWGERFLHLVKEWPAQSPLAFAWAVTETGRSTGDGSGLYSREQWLSGDGRGEYLPVFRGEVARRVGYLAPGCRKKCGTLSYARILEAGPLYVHPEVLRVYHTATPGSVSKSPFDRRKSYDSYVCFHAARQAIEEYEQRMGRRDAPHLSRIYEREALYQIFGQSRAAGLRFALQSTAHLSLAQIARLCAAAMLPRGAVERVLAGARRVGALRAFG